MNRTPRIEASLQQKLKEIDMHTLTECGTRPVSLHFSDIFIETAHFWQRRLDELGMSYQIAFALKATGQHQYARLCKKAGIGIDVASEKELESAIQAGIDPLQILANGPKNATFLQRAIETGCLIAVNSQQELNQINTLTQTHYPKTNVSIICRIKTNGSRFGIDKAFLYNHAQSLNKLHNTLSIVGLSFHSDTILIEEKKKAIQELIALQDHLSQQGHTITYLSIGGGYRVQYCEHTITHQGPREYAQGTGRYGIAFLDELLHYEIDEQPLYEYLSESFTTLIIEPGRALLDQSGVLIHTIIDTQDNTISIDGNIYSLGTIAQEMPHDPLFFSQKKGLINSNDTTTTLEQPTLHETTIYGNLCLESDQIYTRTIPCPYKPQLGDHVLFINTAGYFADFSDAQPIGHTKRKTIFM